MNRGWIGVVAVLMVLAGCGVQAGSIDDFKNLAVGDCVAGNVILEYGWDRIDCSELDPADLQQFEVTWVGTSDEADRLGFLGASFTGNCPYPVEGDGVVVCFK